MKHTAAFLVKVTFNDLQALKITFNCHDEELDVLDKNYFLKITDQKHPKV